MTDCTKSASKKLAFIKNALFSTILSRQCVGKDGERAVVLSVSSLPPFLPFRRNGIEMCEIERVNRRISGSQVAHTNVNPGENGFTGVRIAAEDVTCDAPFVYRYFSAVLYKWAINYRRDKWDVEFSETRSRVTGCVLVRHSAICPDQILLGLRIPSLDRLFAYLPSLPPRKRHNIRYNMRRSYGC